MGAYQAEAQNADLGEAASGIVKDELSKLHEGRSLHFAQCPSRPSGSAHRLDGWIGGRRNRSHEDRCFARSVQSRQRAALFAGIHRALSRRAEARATSASPIGRRPNLKRLNAAGIPDRIFPLFRTWADLRFMDPAIDPSDRPCPGCYRGDPAIANRAPSGIGRANTLKAWLSMWSLETSQCRGEAHLRHTSTCRRSSSRAPATWACFPSDAHLIFDALGAKDKTLEMPKGAHYFEDAPEYRADGGGHDCGLDSKSRVSAHPRASRARDVRRVCRWLRSRVMLRRILQRAGCVRRHRSTIGTASCSATTSTAMPLSIWRRCASPAHAAPCAGRCRHDAGDLAVEMRAGSTPFRPGRRAREPSRWRFSGSPASSRCIRAMRSEIHHAERNRIFQRLRDCRGIP